MFARQQLALGSPKNVTLNVLNANNFFTFDYEPTDRMNQTTNSFIDDQISDQKLRPNRANLMLTLNQNKNTNVKSAQYSRKLLHNPILNKSNMNPYTRIRRVEQIIQQKKQRQSSLEHRNYIHQKQQQQILLPQVVQCQTERLHNVKDGKDKQKQFIFKNFTLDPEYLQDDIHCYQYQSEGRHVKKASKNVNVFSENYKNRRKLLDRTSHRRQAAKISSPLRWDTKPQDLILSEQKLKHWSPYTGKLIDRSNDPLLKSIEGNRIRYMHHQPKYYKGKTQQLSKI